MTVSFDSHWYYRILPEMLPRPCHPRPRPRPQMSRPRLGAPRQRPTPRPGPRCKFTTGRQNQDRSCLSTNHRCRWRDRSRPVLECNAPQVSQDQDLQNWSWTAFSDQELTSLHVTPHKNIYITSGLDMISHSWTRSQEINNVQCTMSQASGYIRTRVVSCRLNTVLTLPEQWRLAWWLCQDVASSNSLHVWYPDITANTLSQQLYTYGIHKRCTDKSLADYRSANNQHLTIGRLPINTKNLFCCLI